jgi:hypothetical protein
MQVSSERSPTQLSWPEQSRAPVFYSSSCRKSPAPSLLLMRLLVVLLLLLVLIVLRVPLVLLSTRHPRAVAAPVAADVD